MRSRSAFLCLAPFALAACGGGDSGTASSGPQAITVPPATPATSANTSLGQAAPAPVAYGYTLAPAAKATAGVALPLGKCVNMGSMLERDREGELLGRPIRDNDFTVIRQAGFATVRLPVKFSSRTGTTAPYTVDPAFMARVRHVVDAATAAGLNIIIDLHAYQEVMDDPRGQRDRFVAIWSQVAEAFKDEPGSVWFELLNEPGYQLWSNVSVWDIYTPAIAEIRRTNPTRPVIVAGDHGSRVDYLAQFKWLSSDPYLVPTFHFYEPHDYTHQGAAWLSPVPAIGRRLADSDHAVIDTAVAQVKSYMKQTGRVPFLGEYGAYDIAGTFTEDRVQYYGWVSAAFASIGVQSCAWSWSNNFKLYDYQTGWVPGMVDAIQTTTTLTTP